MKYRSCGIYGRALAVELSASTVNFWRTFLQFTIEARELTNEYTHRPAYDVESRHVLVDAADADAAITQYVKENESVLVSLIRPGRSRESIATVKKEDQVFLVRIYAA
jgi:hypothetical protein